MDTALPGAVSSDTVIAIVTDALATTVHAAASYCSA